MKRMLIVFHSSTGGTHAMAHAAFQGASAAGSVLVDILSAEAAGADQVLSAQGFLFLAPENLGSMSGVMKDFFDRTYYKVLDRVNGLPYAALICAGSDGHGAARQIERICTGWRLNKVLDTQIVCTHAQTAEQILARKTISDDDILRCREIGTSLAEGLACGIY